MLFRFIEAFRVPSDGGQLHGDQEGSFREVISLQAIVVTQTIALLAYIQREPNFHVRAELMFVGLAAVPLLGLYNILSRRHDTKEGDLFLYRRPVRAYARLAFVLSVVVVAGSSYLYWLEWLPGQEDAVDEAAPAAVEPRQTTWHSNQDAAAESLSDSSVTRPIRPAATSAA